VRPDKEFIARVAVQLLHEWLESEGPDRAAPREVVAPHELMVRESSAAG